MIGNGPLNGFKVKPKSVMEIREIANSVRQAMGIDPFAGPLDMEEFIEHFTKYGITYDILEAREMPHKDVEACCVPEQALICISESVYESACLGDRRPRFTIPHEFGHFILGHRRTLNREAPGLPPKTYEDSEWQANQFAAEFIMPLHVIKERKLNTPWKVQEFFGVSEQAAINRLNQLLKRGEI